MKDSGHPAPGRFVSSSDSGDMAGVVMVPLPSLTKRGSSDSATLLPGEANAMASKIKPS